MDQESEEQQQFRNIFRQIAGDVCISLLAQGPTSSAAHCLTEVILIWENQRMCVVPQKPVLLGSRLTQTWVAKSLLAVSCLLQSGQLRMQKTNPSHSEKPQLPMAEERDLTHVDSQDLSCTASAPLAALPFMILFSLRTWRSVQMNSRMSLTQW